jgi:regulator of sigma E protease
MSILGFTWYYIVVFLLVLTVLVFVHEWGHFWVARKNKVRVEVFSIGFGPELYGWNDKYGTRWKLSAIPLGGYVKMFGEGDEQDDAEDRVELTEEEKAVSFHFKNVRQRAAIVAAGPIVNFIFAIFAFAVLAGFIGTAIPLAGAGKIMPGSAAAGAGFTPGDKILSINGEDIKYFDDLRRIVAASPEQNLSFIVLRDGQEHTLTATPKAKIRKTEDGGQEKIGLLGVEFDPNQIEFERQGPASALWVGVQRTYYVSVNILSYVGDMLSGNRSTDDLGGPLRIAQVSGQMAQQGVGDLILLMAMLSVNLGLINLFPIPMLDGGHLAFYAVEAVLGRPLGPKAQEYGFRFGLILVMMLVVFVTWNDLVHLEVIQFFKDLVT